MRSKDAEKELAAADPLDREGVSGLAVSAAEEELLEAILAEPQADSENGRALGSPLRRRSPRLAMGGAVAVAGVAAALVVSAGGDNTPAAFAVEPHQGGGVAIRINNLSDPGGVEQALAEAGVRSQVTYLAAGMTCREPHYQPSMALLRTLQENQPQPQPWAGFNYESNDGPLTIAVGNYQQRREMDEEIRQAVKDGDLSGAGQPDFVIDPTGFRPDQTLIMSSAPTPAGYQQPVPADSVAGVEVQQVGPEIDTVGQVRVAEGDVGTCQPVPAAEGPAPVRAPQGGWDFSKAAYAGWGF